MASNPTTESLPPPPDDVVTQDVQGGRWSDLWRKDDWWAIWLGGAILIACFAGIFLARPTDFESRLQAIDTAQKQEPNEKQAKELAATRKKLASDLGKPLGGWAPKLEKWSQSPTEALLPKGNAQPLINLLWLWGMSLIVLTIVQVIRGQKGLEFARGYLGLFLLTFIALLLAHQVLVRYYSLEYPLWALLIGLSISNLLGTPQWLKPAVQTEFYIKTGLVLLGAEVLWDLLMQLGLAGVCISWITTPIVLISTYIFGQKFLRMESRTLNIVISADMSVCGTSAAIATAAACRAKKSELSLAIGLSLGFTVIMMILMPILIRAIGLDPIIGGAWIGGTIDATGAVAVAGEALGDKAGFVATTVKMIQNILIGAVAFAVSVYWTSVVEREQTTRTVGFSEIWHRFPKFVLGFIAASAVFSWLHGTLTGGTYLVEAATGASKNLREWLFALAFVSIGLESNLREFGEQLRGGKPLILYVVGQTLNLILTLVMSWLMFGVVFIDLAAKLR